MLKTILKNNPLALENLASKENAAISRINGVVLIFFVLSLASFAAQYLPTSAGFNPNNLALVCAFTLGALMVSVIFRAAIPRWFE